MAQAPSVLPLSHTRQWAHHHVRSKEREQPLPLSLLLLSLGRGHTFSFPSWQSRIRNRGEMYFPPKEPEAEKTEDLPCWCQQCRCIFCP